MPSVTVTAPEGVQLRSRVQVLVQKPQIITTQGFNEHGEPSMVQSFGPKVDTWPDQDISVFASESRDFEVSATQRVIIEAV